MEGSTFFGFFLSPNLDEANSIHFDVSLFSTNVHNNTFRRFKIQPLNNLNNLSIYHISQNPSKLNLEIKGENHEINNHGGMRRIKGENTHIESLESELWGTRSLNPYSFFLFFLSFLFLP